MKLEHWILIIFLIDILSIVFYAFMIRMNHKEVMNTYTEVELEREAHRQSIANATKVLTDIVKRIERLERLSNDTQKAEG